jgi:hypothetical protein
MRCPPTRIASPSGLRPAWTRRQMFARFGSHGPCGSISQRRCPPSLCHGERARSGDRFRVAGRGEASSGWCLPRTSGDSNRHSIPSITARAASTRPRSPDESSLHRAWQQPPGRVTDKCPCSLRISCRFAVTSGLQVFVLHGGCVSGLSDATRDEAIEAETLEITEVSASGQVPTLNCLTAVGGTGSLAMNTNGSALFVLVPCNDVAPDGPTQSFR